MTDHVQVANDWRDECETLNAVLEALDGDAWHKETPAVGWDTRDTVGHLADTNDLMYASITGEGRDLFTEAQAAAREGSELASDEAVDAFTAWQMTKVRKMSGPEAYDWWKDTTKRLYDLLVSLDPKGRYRWGPNTISPMSLGSARLMETWAHSLDVHAAAGVPYTDTDRIHHVAFLGWRAIPYAFGLVGLDAPAPVRLELDGPSGARWTFGADDAPNVIRGTASDWARVVARRDRDGAAGRLEAVGPDAAAVIENGRAFL